MGHPPEPPSGGTCGCSIAFTADYYMPGVRFNECTFWTQDELYNILASYYGSFQCQSPPDPCDRAFCVYVLSHSVTCETFYSSGIWWMIIHGVFNLVGFNDVCDLGGMTPLGTFGPAQQAYKFAYEDNLSPLPDTKYEVRPQCDDGSFQINISNWRDMTSVLIKYTVDE